MCSPLEGRYFIDALRMQFLQLNVRGCAWHKTVLGCDSRSQMRQAGKRVMPYVLKPDRYMLILFVRDQPMSAPCRVESLCTTYRAGQSLPSVSPSGLIWFLSNLVDDGARGCLFPYRVGFMMSCKDYIRAPLHNSKEWPF